MDARHDGTSSNCVAIPCLISVYMPQANSSIPSLLDTTVSTGINTKYCPASVELSLVSSQCACLKLTPPFQAYLTLLSVLASIQSTVQQLWSYTLSHLCACLKLTPPFPAYQTILSVQASVQNF